jgi:polyribonucleotide nucleotidyltransferase
MIKKTLELSGQTLTLETGVIAKQASGSIVLRFGETVVFAAVTANKGEEPDRGFFPLSVEYREKFYASGKIPGGFFKREARPTEHEIISSRLTDRPLRPLFPKGFNNETQVFINVLSYDDENEGDTLGTIAASAALAISDIPWNGPVATVRIGRVENKFIVNPTNTQMQESELEIIVSGTEDSIVMVEGESEFISEDTLLSAIQYAHEAIKDIVKIQNELVAECGKVKRQIAEVVVNDELVSKIDALIDGKIDPLNQPKNKDARYGDVSDFVDNIVEQLTEDYPDEIGFIRSHINDAIAQDLRKKTLAGVRADGRNLTEVRDINIDLGLLPRVHGSSLFTRGETQAVVVATLGGKRDEQMLDNLDGLSYKQFMLHYNFPPYSVGEVRRAFSISRREIGHGNLAERALKRILPDHADFPYTIRIVSEIMESNGSSSMATVCGGTMSLMDAGVPIKAPVAGVAMGLIMEDEDNYAILTDILGTEDHLGDMDFKVAGTTEGITAIQMDLKIDGLPIELMRNALSQAKEARLHILGVMDKTLSEPREYLSKYAPKIVQGSIPQDQIGVLVGPGGKNIKKLIADYECEISVDDDGKVAIQGTDMEKLNQVKEYIDKFSLVPEVGGTYQGEVDKIMDFGAFVKITPRISGLIHISELRWERVAKVEEVVKVGDIVDVKLLKIDDMGRYNLSLKALLDKPDNYKPSNKKNNRR